MSALQDRTIMQQLVDQPNPHINLRFKLESALTNEAVEEVIRGGSSESNRPIPVGVAPAYTQTGRLAAVAIATRTEVLVVQFHSKLKSGDTSKSGKELLQREILCHADCLIFTFDLNDLATSLFRDHHLRLTNGIDIQSVCPGQDRRPLTAIEFAVGDRVPLNKENIESVFAKRDWEPSDKPRMNAMAFQAWMASYVARIDDMEARFQNIPRVNTQDMDETRLALLAQVNRGDQRLASKKPTAIVNEFDSTMVRNRNVQVKASRYQTRFQKTNLEIKVRDNASGAEYMMHGRTADVSGRSASIRANMSLEGKTITSFITADDRPTNLESRKAQSTLHALQGKEHIFVNPFLNFIWFRDDDFTWPEAWTPVSDIPICSQRPLNDSQLTAVEHMLTMSDDTRITMIHGPPGTGKTTVIAAYVTSAIAAGMGGIWLVAQSNVAVKNIAEKLADVGFLQWRLLVSNDFHMDWHEHHYQSLSQNVICSNEFKTPKSYIQECPVILCTLSMLSNHFLYKFTSQNPIQSLVIDEASQIALSDYIPTFTQISTLRKVCFIGDNKQLPPFGQEEIEDIQSIFEVSHLHSNAILLNVQYRMPPQIGDIISDAVYNGQLQSNPLHPVKDDQHACYFVDIEQDQEIQDLFSYKNYAQCKVILQLAARLQSEGKSYRIITPYEAQRNLLENQIKCIGLQWQNKCFNVDSFQGKCLQLNTLYCTNARQAMRMIILLFHLFAPRL
ncbi:P-loop containing nucleoside triphosphate hydrolase protein [Obba rivulosa]|uniref:P-loop containing nucleoside triphosphate hydrolase protein n=1 Tax=Obba rivulosa TaxID=1052685 RepID=A0A8E2DRA8_9APHY|nr:P-loop containing nucleoside triphosphate hydrolase protein [Obba rivulosa]